MKCIAHKKSYAKAREKLIHDYCRFIVKYLTTATAEIMLEKFNWSQERLEHFIRDVWSNFDLTNTPLVNIEDFNPKENYGYEVAIKHTLVRDTVSPYTRHIDSCREQAVRWFIDMLVFTLKNSYDWADSTTDRFVSYLNGYLPALRDGTASIDGMLDGLKLRHGLELRMEVV